MDHIRQKFRSRFDSRSTSRRGSSTTPTRCCATSSPGQPVIARACVFVVDRGLRRDIRISSPIEGYCQRHRDVLALAAPVLVVPGGEAIKNDSRHVDAIHRVINDGGTLPSFVRGRRRRRRRARRGRLRGGDRASRHPADPDSDHGALAGRFGGRREERHQRLRQEELSRHVRAAVRRHQRLELPADAARSRLARRDLRSHQGGADSGSATSSTSSSSMPRRSKARDLAAMEEVVRRSAALHLAHIATGGDPFEQGSSRPLDFGHWAAHKLEALTDYRLRHGEAVGDRHRARHDLRVSHRLAARERSGAASSTSCRPLGLAVHAPELERASRRPGRSRAACCPASTSFASTSAAS